MKTATIVLTIVGIGAGFLAGRLLAPSNQTEVTELTTRVETATAESEKNEAERKEFHRKAQSLENQNQRLQKELSGLREEFAAVEQRAEELQAEKDGVTAADEPEDTGHAGNAQFAFDQYSEALASVDWKKDVGENMAAMVPHIVKILESIQAGTPPPPESVGATQRHNGPLVTVAMNLSQKGVPGTGVNGSFSHPAVMVNSIAATLEAAELPLDTSQSARMESLGRDYTARDDQRMLRYDERTFELKKIADEAVLKTGFFDAAFKLLTAAQIQAISPELTRDRLRADIFSSTLMWVGRAKPIRFASREDLGTTVANEMSGELARGLKLPESATPKIQAIVTDWVNSIPESRLHREMDPLDQIGMFTGAHILEGATETLRLLQELANGLDLDEEQAKGLREVGFTTVLYRKPNL